MLVGKTFAVDFDPQSMFLVKCDELVGIEFLRYGGNFEFSICPASYETHQAPLSVCWAASELIIIGLEKSREKSSVAGPIEVIAF